MEALMLLNCGVGEDLTPLDCKEIQPVHPKGNQSWIFIGRTDAEAEASIRWQYLMQRTDSLEKTLMLGKIEGGSRRGWQRMRWLKGITNSMVMNLRVSSGSWWWTGKPGVLQSLGSQRVGHDWVTELSWRTGRNIYVISIFVFFCVSCDHVLCVWSCRCACVVCMYISVYAHVIYVKFVCAYVYTWASNVWLCN